MSRLRHRKVRPSASCLVAALVVTFVAALPNSATAASATWTGNSGANSNWSTTANWNTTPVPGTGDTATFSGAGNGRTTITTGNITINTIFFDTSSAAAYTLGPTVGTGTISLNDSGAIT